ncbi:MAG: Delta(1)-pyrroline-2-carboxylate reductase [Anaerolineae bacterium]|nr:Delta(1)-pyrroline-2-carboxylate reductase [Anaerolineae bacterium]
MRILSHRDVEQAVTMPQAIEVMQDAFARLANHQATVPLRSQLPVPQYNGVALFMPAYIQGTDALAIKIVNVFGDNAQRGLPLIHAVVVVLEAQTGRALALIEGGALTALRTGAGCGAATIALARSDARVGLVFGAGVQARTQLRALCAARQLERVYVYDPAPAKAQAMLAELRARPELPADLRVADDVASAVRAADIISCATTSKQPLFDGNDVQPGAHVNAIGSFTPEARETDDAFIKRCNKIVVDAYSGALAEAGDLIQPMEQGILDESDLYAELGEITSGKKMGRVSADEITFFKSVGNAVQDAALAQALLQRAEALGLGVNVEL